ncbi:acetyl-coenzyme A carboxylase carboxyl transferase subunit beta, chloroplastic-like [Lathyrus oleraceus]|uniref:acetyl-coenzyme A carboxylase carboxyl transferase subunit beta, chloroplastic-like n=1 Tax=Pisum sativum TaxID=3888 RepID=UPI001FC6780F|nr:acetyl-coenzyme A carboxylase carboxyl transferase subunit beta, chloroplastic-like [Pisum sativum]
MIFNRGLEYRCGLSKSIDSFGPIGNNVNEDPSSLTDMDNNIDNWKNNSENSCYSHADSLADVTNIDNLLSHKKNSIRDSNSNIYDIYYAYDTNDTIELDSEEESLKDRLDEDMLSPDPIELDSEEESSKDRVDSEEEEEEKDQSYIDRLDSYQEKTGLPETVQTGTDQREEINRLFKDIMNKLDLYLQTAKNRVDSEEEEEEKDQSYINRLDSYQEKTGLPAAVQTGTGQLNGIPLALVVMDSEFIAGSMGYVVGEKITRLIEYATNLLLPLIIVCASGGARMQEGSLSLMQMAKISSALYNYQINQKLFYVAILTSPSTSGVTSSFGMLGDIIIVEPNATIAFAGKRVIEQLLNKEVPEGSQSADLLFDKGLLDAVVPRHLLKEFLTELFQFHGFAPLT